MNADEAERTSALRPQIAALLPELRAYARFVARNRTDADDLVQEAVVRALRALDQFRPGSNLRAWLFTILRRAWLEQRRRSLTEERVLAAHLHDATPVSAAAQHGHAELSDLQRRLWQLSPVLREAIVLVGAQGLDYEEAAVFCDVPVGTMKARVSRARRLLASVKQVGLLAQS